MGRLEPCCEALSIDLLADPIERFAPGISCHGRKSFKHNALTGNEPRFSTTHQQLWKSGVLPSRTRMPRRGHGSGLEPGLTTTRCWGVCSHRVADLVFPAFSPNRSL